MAYFSSSTRPLNSRQCLCFSEQISSQPSMTLVFLRTSILSPLELCLPSLSDINTIESNIYPLPFKNQWSSVRQVLLYHAGVFQALHYVRHDRCCDSHWPIQEDGHAHFSVLQDDGCRDVSAVFLNSNNTELAPSMAGVGFLARFPFIARCHDMPTFTVKDKEIINA